MSVDLRGSRRWRRQRSSYPGSDRDLCRLAHAYAGDSKSDIRWSSHVDAWYGAGSGTTGRDVARDIRSLLVAIDARHAGRCGYQGHLQDHSAGCDHGLAQSGHEGDREKQQQDRFEQGATHAAIIVVPHSETSEGFVKAAVAGIP